MAVRGSVHDNNIGAQHSSTLLLCFAATLRRTASAKSGLGCSPRVAAKNLEQKKNRV